MRITEPSSFDNIVSQNMKNRRKELGISMRLIAETVSPPVSVACVHGWESYMWRIPLEYLLQIAEILNCSILELLTTNSTDIQNLLLRKQLEKLTEIRKVYAKGHTVTARKHLSSVKGNYKTKRPNHRGDWLKA